MSLATVFKILIVHFVLAIAFIGCTKKQSEPVTSDPQTITAEALITKGRNSYQTNCSACHNMDPKKPGNLGPEVFGASRELIERRVIHGDYPAGYTPKRASKAMVALPHMKNDIEALTAYLNSP
ncbi:MAG: cytochrome c [Bdellovibrionales bacterium]